MTLFVGRTKSVYSLFLAALAGAGCGDGGPGAGRESGGNEQLAAVSAALTSIPVDVTCVSFTLSGSTTGTRRFTVTPNAVGVKLDLGRLPLGSITLAPVAHNLACASVVASSTASWLGASVSANVVPGVVTEIPIALRQNVPVAANVDFVGVAQSIGLGYFASYAVLTDGTLRSWGLNNNGQLGNGTTTDRLVPGPVSGISGVKKVSGGNNHACALTDAGQIYCWGAGSYGQLGNNSTFGVSNPTLVSGSDKYRDLGCGENDTCAAVTTGRHRCWGDNSRGQLNDFTTTNRLVPTDATSLGYGQLDLLVVGERTTFAFGGNEAGCDGAASDGQLGNGATSEDPTTGWSGCHVNNGMRFVTTGDAGPYHSCVVEASLGKVYCSGNNGSGQLGTSNTTSTVQPVEVVGLSNITAVATGWTHTCALRADGNVWCWGSNSSGQLGDGTGTTRLSPTPVSGLANVSQIAAANNQSCALKTDGSVWCWGNNDYGQLGNGNLANRSTPTRVQL